MTNAKAISVNPNMNQDVEFENMVHGAVAGIFAQAVEAKVVDSIKGLTIQVCKDATHRKVVVARARITTYLHQQVNLNREF